MRHKIHIKHKLGQTKHTPLAIHTGTVVTVVVGAQCHRASSLAGKVSAMSRLNGANT